MLITDGGSDPAGAAGLRERAVKLGVTVLGIAIDVDPSRLEPWCDEVIAAPRIVAALSALPKRGLWVLSSDDGSFVDRGVGGHHQSRRRASLAAI